jgi:hypothetical protein
MNTPNLDFSYRAALALNNMGVSLLEQGCFNEGLRPLKDSLSIMKGILEHHQHTSSTSNFAVAATHDERNVQLKMQSATILLAECQMGRSQTEPSQAADVYALDHGDLTLMKDALRYGSSSSVAFPVYLRSTAAFDKDVEQQVAVVLYNISVAILLNHAHGSDTMDTTTTEEQQQESNNILLDAFQYLSIAQTILSQSIEDTNNHDEDQRLVSMLLTAMVLNMLVQTYKYLNWHQKEQDAMSSLLLLESIVNEHEAATSIAGYLNSCHVIPPAA